ncbi:MAG: macro domain-containing protein, partial [Candidatus Omnitrophica bacterium]|nr:macro domain-containing protein [Candidatus Omnitrophota bacterium]
IAFDYKLQSIAFPCISTGVYRFPKQIAAQIAVQTVTESAQKSKIEVIFACFDEENFEIYSKLTEKR